MQASSTAEVAFHFNVPDRVDYTARLLRKAWGQGARCQVLAADEELAQIDDSLWLRFPGEFLAHSVDADPEAVRRRSPLHLGRLASAGVSVRIILDGGDPGELLHGVRRVIEVVGADEADRERARHRWRAYRQLGIEPQRHDLSGK